LSAIPRLSSRPSRRSVRAWTRGGDLFVIANVDGLLEEYVGTLSELARLAPAKPGSGEQTPAELVEKVAAFLKKNGFYAVSGGGLSVVPRADGLNAVKMFTRRDDAAALLPLWRAVVGTTPSDMACLSYLPKDTVIARSGTADLNALWALVKQGISEIGGEEAAQGVTAGLAMAEQQLGTSVDSIFASLAPEGAFSLQLSTTATAPIPVGAQVVDLPVPSVLIVIAVKDDTILDTIKRTFATQLQMPLPEVHVGGAVLHTIPIPLPVPVPVQITLAKHGQYLLIGSTTAVVTDAIQAATEGNGLKALPEYVAAFAGAEEKNNGITFMSQRLGTTIAGIQSKVMEQATAADPESKASMDFVSKWMAERFSSTAAFTIMNYRSGIKISGTSSSGGRELVASLMMAPLGMISAIAIPSFVKARGASQQNACINNLRQLDAAKEQWALAERKPDGEAPEEEAVLQYVKGAAMPVCPQGGVYTLNPIGAAPTCSDPGHSQE